MVMYIVLGFLFVVIIAGTISVVVDLLRYGSSRLVNARKLLTPLTSSQKAILNKSFTFYQRLAASDKTIFEKRINQFMASKTFVPRGIPKVTEEMKVLISASAVQLTFGLPPVFLKHFQRILVYPDNYYSNISKKYHKGEVNPRHGVIALSWVNFVGGYADETDSLNLGLHEMAHALRLENKILNGESGFLNPSGLRTWEHFSLLEIEAIQSGKESIFRSYGATDLEEFFAVAVEVFFERPDLFEVQSPKLFKTLSLLLNQNPANWNIN